MDWFRILLSRGAALFRSRDLDADLDEELRAHIECAIAENLKAGMKPQEARTAALRSFGGVAQTREDYRVQRGFPWLEQIARDVRFASRALRKSPGFTLTAVLTLALGIGAVTSVFSVVNAVLLKPFAFRDPGRLVVVRETADEFRGNTPAIPDNYRHFLRLKETAKSIEDAALFRQGAGSLSVLGDHPRMVGTVETSPNLFRVLGVYPVLGRDFVDVDSAQGAGNVVLSYEGWQTLFQGNPQTVGQTFQLGLTTRTVIGVLPQGMRFPQIVLSPNIAFQETSESRVPMVFGPFVPNERDLKNDEGNYNYKVIARLKPGASLEQASAELDALQHAYSVSAHLPIHLGIAVSPLAKDVASGISGALWLLFAAVGGVLLIGCVNLANLQMARTTAAMRET